ncbi:MULTISPECIES: type 1 periplasmic binding fold superfamily protein [unclassified Flavobacterium]|uniref:type 1 periplasmic binding fold superfamily protein n=1 Tax=unclassified Flavobacterium TaxID=196869 RepID=UPI001292332B|nr:MULTISPECIES: type 1 periplasmic binding fold superfamily protein [unclassified Flavobacterium]MQP53246.1 type 1 periplasmic binding fold superfamily protein [Flavobacterium sp. LMO9]MQP63257.1 type 1 periplasmic binding fold superfamily protein [Flavobacterium sp. LMO6]
MKNLKLIALFVIPTLILTSCSNEDTVVNEEEVITTVTTTLTGGGQVITLTSTDLDGDGPNTPIITVSENLVAGRTYLGSTTFSNELANPAEDITMEVEEEGDEHQVFYQLAASLGTVTYNDTDVNGDPIGLEFTLVAGTSGSTGTLTVTLRHEPIKSANGVANGDITNAEGSTDAQVSFNIEID